MLKIEYVKTADLIPYANNPRKNDAAVDKVVESIREFGFKNPIIVDGNNEIIAGHTRLKAAEKLGMEEVPTIKAEDLTPEQVKAFRIADNKTHEFAEWDMDLLREELDGINLFTGFNEDEIEDLMTQYHIDFDEFDGEGDGGGSYVSSGNKVRVVIGALMFDINDDDHAIYGKTKNADADVVKAQIMDLINKGELL